MKVTYKDDKCIIIEFDDSQTELRRQGWLGDESEARIFSTTGLHSGFGNKEIRIFKKNGESYVLHEDSREPMICMKIKKLFELANNA